jgi:Zn-dependent membrane protease YugP
MLFYFIVPLLLSFYVSWRFKSKVKEYSQISLSNHLTGAEIAQQMLSDNGIFDVQIFSAEGELSDHYNPEKKTVNLSHDVYYGRSVISAAVAAHEVGHAVQHAKGYAWLKFRSAVVPVVSVASKYVQWILLGGVLLINTFPQLLLIGILLFAATTVFTVITLPVEFDASKRALAWVKSRGIVNTSEYDMAQDALKWAAMTYVVAAVGAVTTLIYYVLMFLGIDRD